MRDPRQLNELCEGMFPSLFGIIECVAKGVHKGRTTQIRDAEVRLKDSGKTIALFRCTQMVLYPK